VCKKNEKNNEGNVNLFFTWLFKKITHWLMHEHDKTAREIEAKLSNDVSQ